MASLSTAGGVPPVEKVKDRLDENGDGKVSRSEFSVLDENADGKTTKKEAEDLDRDGKAERKEKDLLDADRDGKVTRHEILQAPEADADNNGVITKQELKQVATPASTKSQQQPQPPASQPAHHGHSTAMGSSSSSGHGGTHHGGTHVASASPATPRPPRTSWKLGLWDTYEDCFTEVVLVLVCAVTLHRAIQWLYRRLTRPKGGKQSYKKVARANALDA